MTKARLIYVTTKSREQAIAIGREIVERRLAACANVLPAMTSLYRWQGEVEEAAEAVLILKTEVDRVDEAVAAVRELHDYQVPCALVLPVLGGNPDYLAWLADSVKAP